MVGRRLVGAIGVVPLVAFALSGCGDEHSEVIVDPAGSGPPGARITDDFVVPPGTTLLGAPFASHHDARPWTEGLSTSTTDPKTLGIRAVLRVTGDPIEAVADVFDQADAAGIEMMTYQYDEDPGPVCHVTNAPLPHESGDWAPLGTEELPDGALAVQCNASGLSDAVDDVQVGLELEAFVSERTDPYSAFLQMHITEYRLGGGPTETLPDGYRQAPPLDGGSPVQPPRMPEPSQSGDPIGAQFDEVSVLDGSTLMAPPVPSTTCSGDGNGGSAVVLRVDGDLDELIERYQQEFGDPAIDDDEAFRVDGSGYRYRDYDGGGGYGTLSFRGTTGPGQPAYLMLERCPG